MTFTSKQAIEKIIKADGYISEGIDADTIWQYDDVGVGGKRLYAVFADSNHDMFISPYVFNPVLLWSKAEGKIQDPT